jgi:hypothetical protein
MNKVATQTITRKGFQMSLQHSIAETSTIRNFIMSLSFAFYFSKPVFQHIEEFINGAVQAGYRGKVIQIVTLSHALCHRSTYERFLSQGVWTQDYVWRAIRKTAIDTVYTMSRQSQQPIFAIHDDTICEKTKPSSQAKRPIAETAFHHSHLDNKSVWGHQMLTTLLSCQKKVLPYFIERYQRNGESKIDKVCRVVKALPTATGPAYGLCDSWFTCQKVIEAHWQRGYHLIGGLKTNRIIYPSGVRTSVKDFEQYIEKNDVHLVTVGRFSYWTYRYEGALNGIDHAVVILCWPKNAFKEPKCLHAFLCTDTELSTQTILEHYSQRWPIEVFFRQAKGNLGLNKYQVRSVQAIDRILALIALTYLYCSIGTGRYQPLGIGLRKARKVTQRDKVTMIYHAAKNGISMDTVFQMLKIA